MCKKGLLKAVAIVVCFGVLSLSVPGAIAAEKKVPKPYKFLKKPLDLITSMFPILHPIFDPGKKSISNKKAVKKIKVGGTLSSTKVADGD